MPGGPVATGGGLTSASSTVTTIAIAGFAAFGGILFGFESGYVGGILAMEPWLRRFGTFGQRPGNDPNNVGYFIKTGDKSLVVSILSAGNFFGALLSSPIADHLGRKYGIILACAVFCLGVGLQNALSWGAFIAGRFIGGLGVGMVSTLVPMYQSEVSPKAVRGFVVGLYQWAITIGIFLASVVNQCTKDRGDDSAWRIPVNLQFLWAVILAAGMFVLPESPRYLLLKGRLDNAKKSVAFLTRRNKEDPVIEQELADIQLALDAELALGKASYMDCFRNNASRNGWRTWSGIWIQGWQQLTGVNFIFYYGPTFFAQSGIGQPFLINIATSVVNIGMTIPGILLIDRMGRRSMLMYGAAVMVLCEFIVAIVGVTVGQPTADGAINFTAQRVLIAFVCIYIAAFASTWGPIAWVVTGEIFPLAIRSKAMSLSVASNWLWNFAIGYATPYLVDPTTTGVNGVKTANLGVKVFFVWGSTCLGCLIFTYFFIPETKGLSLEQVDLLYRESSIIKSNQYRREMLARDETFLNHDGVSPKGGKFGEVSHHNEHEKTGAAAV